jgi:FkbM family methyltransferase
LLALSLGFNKCLAVEPTPDLAASLRRTFRTFEEVRVAEVAVTNSPSSTVNFSNRYFWSVENRVVPDSEAQNLDRVPNARLVDLIQEHSIDRISLLKMDIEGAEEEVILGLEDDVWSRIDRLHLEIHQMYGVQGDSLIAYVTQQGFEVLDFKDRSPILEILFQKIIPGTDFS